MRIPAGESVAVLGGTFDPVHAGHLALARAALKHLPIDRVIFLPTARSPFKKSEPVASGPERFALLVLATRHEPRFEVSPLELESPRAPRYTLDSLREIRRHYRPRALWWLMGMDNLAGFAQWKRPNEILRLARLGVAARPGNVRPELPSAWAARVDFLPLRRAVSAGALRAVLRTGQRAVLRAGLPRPIEFSAAAADPLDALPPSVRSYLAQHPLYSQTRQTRKARA